MHGLVPRYEMLEPKSLTHALSLSKTHTPFAGGTDLMVLLEAGKLEKTKYFNLWNVEELRGIEVSDKEVALGALTTYSEILEHRLMQSEFQMLCQAARETGAIAIQNRGTLGGNIINASPAADSPPALLAYGATLELLSEEGKREVAYENFHLGYKKMDLKPGEILSKIRVKRKKNGAKERYQKVGTRRAQAISKVCFAGLSEEGAIRLAFGSVAPTPIRASKVETLLSGKTIDPKLIEKARETLAKDISPIGDIRSTQSYRLEVAKNVLEDFLKELM